MSDTLFQTALQHHQAGRLAEARKLYRQILDSEPRHSDALHLLGLVCGQSGEFAAATDFIARAIAINPRVGGYYLNLGTFLKAQGRTDDAIAAYRKVIEIDPQAAEGHNNLGNALQDKKQLAEALACFERAIALKPEYAEAHHNLGNVLKDQGKFDPAIAACRRAIQICPNAVETYSNLCSILMEKRDYDQALLVANAAIAVNPGRAEGYFHLGNALRDKDEPEQAIAAYRRAIELDPTSALSYCNMAVVLGSMGRYAEALATCRTAIQINPGLPEAHYSYGYLLLLCGDFTHGWAEYEFRWKLSAFPIPSYAQGHPQWDGSDLGGRSIVLYAEQGVGDTIQFVRYAPWVAQRGGRIILLCAPELKRMLSHLGDVAQVLCLQDPVVEFDFQCPLLNLPRIFGTDLHSIPPPAVFPLDDQLTQFWRRKLEGQSDKMKVGLAWAGNPSHHNDRRRSIPLARLRDLASVENVHWFSLQKGPAAAQVQDVGQFHLIDHTQELHDFADTAALIAQLDLVITADTAVAHLAGTMGKAVWVMLPSAPDWRWMLDRDDSPWYSTMRLFRQRAAGDWNPVVQSVVSALRQMNR